MPPQSRLVASFAHTSKQLEDKWSLSSKYTCPQFVISEIMNETASYINTHWPISFRGTIPTSSFQQLSTNMPTCSTTFRVSTSLVSLLTASSSKCVTLASFKNWFYTGYQKVRWDEIPRPCPCQMAFHHLDRAPTMHPE